MMNIRINFSNATIADLEAERKKADQTNNAKLFKRVSVLLCYAKGMALDEIIEIFRISRRTIYQWLCEFILRRWAWLRSFGKGRGRKPKINKEQRRRLAAIIDAGPEAYGLDEGIWKASSIQWVIQEEFNVYYASLYIPELLKKMGFSYQRAKFVSDHLDEEKRRVWVEETWPEILKKAKETKAIILFGDEVSFAQWGSLSRTWARKGKQPVVKTTGKRKALKVFGVIEFFSGEFIYREQEGKFNSETYREFLDQVLNALDAQVILIQDGARYHTSKDMQSYFEEKKDRLTVYQLPSYSPDYNPIEKLWKKTKEKATHNKYFPKFEDLKRAVIKAFGKFMMDSFEVISIMKAEREKALCS
jgi:transposase